MRRNLSVVSLLNRRYQHSPPATVLEALPARLVVHSERHWIRDTNHTAADRPYAASKQDNHDAEATISNSSLKHDHQKRGDDESTFEHDHVPLRKISFSVSCAGDATKTAGDVDNIRSASDKNM